MGLLRCLYSRNLEPWVVLWSFFLLKFLFISTSLSYDLAWHAVIMSGPVILAAILDKLDKLQRQVCTSVVGGSLAIYLELLSRCRNVGNSNLFCRYCFGRCSMNWLQLVPVLYYRGRSTCYYIWLRDFSVTIHECYKDVCHVFFNSLTQLDSEIFYLQNAFFWHMI